MKIMCAVVILFLKLVSTSIIDRDGVFENNDNIAVQFRGKLMSRTVFKGQRREKLNQNESIAG